ncbi:MAG: DoxX family protein [Chloroflexota bacterium]
MTHSEGGPGEEGEPAAHPAGAPRGGRLAAMRLPTVSVIGLLPLRIFLGVTYLYAGLDKFANPHFLAAGDPFNVAGQMAAFARQSPLEPLITAVLPAAIPIGVLIALGELAIGIGLLTGLSLRLAAAGGAAFSVLFWLTASWSSTPYFFSPDLPYAVGFLTLAIVGHGGLLVVGIARDRAAAAAAEDGAPLVSAARRSVLQLGALAGLTLLTGGAAALLRALASGGNGGSAAAATRAPTPAPATPAPATLAPATLAPTAAPTPGAIQASTENAAVNKRANSEAPATAASVRSDDDGLIETKGA